MTQLAKMLPQVLLAAIDPSNVDAAEIGTDGVASSGQDPVLIVASVVFVLLMIVLTILLARAIRNRTRLLQESDAEAELLFEKRMSREAARLLGESGRNAQIEKAITAAASEPPLVRDEGFVHEAPDGGGDRAGTIEELGRRLFALRIVTDREGNLELDGRPAIAYRLKRGGVCAVVEGVADENAALRLCRRFDMVFVLTKEGDTLVYQRLQSRLRDFLSLGERSAE
ncbi:hypothetical protein BH09SUM1_BH09SUM1_09840 [soil metagenome]